MSENQKEPQYKLRWPEDLRDKVMNSAKEQNRSINAEIIARLEESFEKKNYDHDFFEKNLHMFLATYCAGLESNYDEAISQIEDSLSKTKNPEMIQFLEHRLQVNKVLKAEMHRLKKSNAETYKSLQFLDPPESNKAP